MLFPRKRVFQQIVSLVPFPSAPRVKTRGDCAFFNQHQRKPLQMPNREGAPEGAERCFPIVKKHSS